MKKTQFKDAVRNIKKRWISYLSVIIIAILGTSIFLSIGFASQAIFRNGSQMYDSMNFRSVELVSTLFVTPDDLDVFREMDEVACAEPVWQAGAEIYHGEDGKADAAFVTLCEEINVPQLLEGRLPKTPNECVIEQGFADEMQFKVGDTINDFSMTDDAGQYLLEYEFLITGIVTHPDHISRTVTETGYVLVTKEAFDRETLKDASMKAEILMENGDGDRFSDEHRAAVSALVEKIEAMAPERTPLTDEAVKKAAHDRIDDMERDYREGLDTVMRETPEDTEMIEIYEANIAGLDEHRKSIDNMAPCRWIVLGEGSSSGYDQVRTCGETLRTLQLNFGLMFIAIGALTILATVGKMVGEQRKQVGTVKALGFYKREVLMKYLLFGVSAVVIGAAAGSLAGRYLFERIVLENYKSSFAVDLTKPLFNWTLVLIVLAAAVVLAVGTVWVACRNLVKESASSLMQSPVPNGAKRTQKEKKHSLGLYSRLIFRNIRSDWKRVAVTIVSVLGCCAMIGVGFTLKAAVNNCPEKQYSDIVDYDMKLVFDLYSTQEFQSVLDGSGAESVSFYSAAAAVKIKDYSAAELMIGDIGKISSMYHLYDRRTGEKIAPTDDGVYIHRRLAETADLDVGSEFELTIGLADSATVKVAGVFENYLGLPIVMSDGYYVSQYSKEYAPNAFLVRLNGADPEALRQSAKEDFSLLSWTESDSDRAAFDIAMGSINSVDALLTLIAAIMAGGVQMCLTSTYILQKKRELILMRINGFTVKELVGYLLRETVFTTAVGIVLGVAAGCGIGHYIVRSVELPYAQFDRGVCPRAWLYAVGITLLFTIVINAIALQKVKKLKLTDLE